MDTVKITKKLVADLLPKDRDGYVWDSGLGGFGLRVKSSGRKTYMLQYRNTFGTSRRLTIGSTGDLTLDQARKEAKRLKGLIALGQDPVQDRREAKSGGTVRELAERYMSDHCDGRCKDSTIAAHQWLLDRFILPRLGSRPIKSVSTGDISALHTRLRETPYNANRVLGLLKAMYSKAEQWGLMEARSNPASVVKPFKERKRQRFLRPEEFRRLAEVIDEQERFGVIGMYQAAAIRLLVLTGCRMGEILSLRWDSVDFENRRLLLEHHKTDHKGAKAIPLNQPALQILKDLQRESGNPYVIVGFKEGEHLVNLQKPWKRVREAAGLPDVRIHDLRHSFASAAASAGIPLQIIGGLLGHSSPQTTARYAHLSQDPVDQASAVVGEIILKNSFAE